MKYKIPTTPAFGNSVHFDCLGAYSLIAANFAGGQGETHRDLAGIRVFPQKKVQPNPVTIVDDKFIGLCNSRQ
jgi:hypothetical protein